jgi:hypothetical protein
MKSGRVEHRTPPPDRWPSAQMLEQVSQRLRQEPLVKRAYLASITHPGQTEGCLQLGLEFKEGLDTNAPTIPPMVHRLNQDIDPLIGLKGGILVVNIFHFRGGFEEYVREIPCIYDAEQQPGS